ncbi:hypothetical protein ARAF_1643 [Arsenophonus endosymbiont of Aleurodicus floccissimus]|uniref:hypothetical protein n=1 Tax=Arsenophonus endosymbiont of Aleurodicus floccissimus TaxID=2152761 RepID=UPI000E6B4E3E|nr:hypothetical protein [Arsenophonus endosymbiont of Aleurodicus floccissimus]SPP31974.1 hypothetical protein ARAF_1643 [Arsenophonus endosymbiont of Aleurodicus floccissimus]
MKSLYKIFSIIAALGFSFITIANDNNTTRLGYVIVPTPKGDVKAESWTYEKKNGGIDLCWEDPKKGLSCLDYDTREMYEEAPNKISN